VTIAYWCVLVMVLFPYLFTILAKSGPGFNNSNPRGYLEKVEGWRKRAHWVQVNNFETFPAFAVSVIIAHQLHANQTIINELAIIFVMARTLHAICYIANLASLRTLFWFIGLGCVVTLFFISP
jgi:uncharacterized MAPEG superfamily protein